jgi:long-chain acyl-CoA synthetase
MRETQGMQRQSVLEYFQPNSRPGNEIAVAWRRGYRMIRWSYADLRRAAARVAGKLKALGLTRNDRVLLWGENSGEWVAAFLGCLLIGAVAVPMDAIAEKGFARRVAEKCGARVVIIGRGLPSLDLPVETLALESFGESEAPTESFSPAQAGPDDPAEIVFTSGTTSEPRGVVLTHGNLLANLEPIEKEIERYRKYERIFHPLRFLDLLPLSHVFGQLLGIFLPQVLGATSVFADTLNPGEVIRLIRREKVSVLVTVPRLADSLKEQIERDLLAKGRLEEFQIDLRAAKGERFWKHWWRFRGIHRRFGWKFWAIISGGATLSPETETFWSRLGFAVIQGYGLTETTSLISVNHPFRLGRGSIGKALPGLEVKLGEDGEILVRGKNVAQGYWGDTGISTVRDEQGWFHTGDIGERDAQGNLYFKGRRKNIVVTPEGLNVYPEDLEIELRKEPGVRDCVVLGLARNGNAEPCAILLLRETLSGAEAAAAEIVHRANTRLAPFQQMRHWMVWPDKDFPRTSTHKPMLGRIREVTETRLGHASLAGVPGGEESSVRDLLARISGGRTIDASDTAQLQLTSIERVELLSALEDRYQMDLGETEFAQADTIGTIGRLLEHPPEDRAIYHYPRWAQSWPVRLLRAAAFYLLARPAMRILGWPRVRGRENMRGVTGPVLVIANHVAFFDPAYVREALPAPLRRRLAVAMDGELLESLRNPAPGTGFFTAVAHCSAYWLVVSLFNVFPLPLHAGFRKSFAFAGDLIDRGWSVLVFPEGQLTKDGQMSPFRSGIGLLASQLHVPVVPVRLDGIFELKVEKERWARPGRIRVSIGAPANFSDSDAPEKITRELEQRVAALG